MYRILVISLFISLFSNKISSQTLDDALRLSIHEYNSTARFAGVSGAFSALGADASIANINPAGIAEFRKSEITGTVNFVNTENKTNLDGESDTKNIAAVGLGNLSAIFHYQPFSATTRTLNLAIGYSQIANYTEDLDYSGRGPGTIVERFLERAEGSTPNELDIFQGGPAFDAGAIYDIGDTNYESDFITLNEVVDRSETIRRSGSLDEVYIGIGSNIKNKISWGVTLGFPFAKFQETKQYMEADPNDEIDFFNNIGYLQDLNTSGVGFNLKLGVIYKLNPRLRIGAALHTKSYFFLKDEFNTRVDYSFTADNNTESNSASSPVLNPFEYQFEGPWRALAGIGYIYSLGDLKGFVSGEIEYVGYTSAAFNLTANSTDPIDQFFQDDLNSEIDDFLSSALNVRVGTEVAYKMLRLRVGVMLPKTPFSDASALDYKPSFSAGLGYRGNRFYVDAAYTLRSSTTNYKPYPLLDASRENIVDIDSKRSIATLTVGYKI